MHRNIVELPVDLVIKLQRLEERQMDLVAGFISGARLEGPWTIIENFTKLERLSPNGTDQQAPAETTS
jgi:hypothetical protein